MGSTEEMVRDIQRNDLGRAKQAFEDVIEQKMRDVVRREYQFVGQHYFETPKAPPADAQ